MFSFFWHPIFPFFPHLFLVGDATLFLVDKVEAGVALGGVLGAALVAVLDAVVGRVDGLALFLGRELALLLVDRVVDGVVHGLVDLLAAVAVAVAARHGHGQGDRHRHRHRLGQDGRQEAHQQEQKRENEAVLEKFKEIAVFLMHHTIRNNILTVVFLLPPRISMRPPLTSGSTSDNKTATCCCVFIGLH